MCGTQTRTSANIENGSNNTIGCINIVRNLCLQKENLSLYCEQRETAGLFQEVYCTLLQTAKQSSTLKIQIKYTFHTKFELIIQCLFQITYL